MLFSSPQHGYAILAEIHKSFGILLSPGVLYPLLYEFEAHEWVEILDDNRKKVFRITPKGIEKMEQLKTFYLKSFNALTKLIQ